MPDTDINHVPILDDQDQEGNGYSNDPCHLNLLTIYLIFSYIEIHFHLDYY